MRNLACLALFGCSFMACSDVPEPLASTGGDALVQGDLPAVPDANPTECSLATECVEDGMVCDLVAGVCKPPSCIGNADTCASSAYRIACDRAKGDASLVRCPEDTACVLGVCEPKICDPADGLICEEGKPFGCSSDGTARTPQSCFGGRSCIQGDCRPILHNVMLLFDTSFSMNDCADGSIPDGNDCCSGGCIQEWPVCETADTPVTKLGISKKVFSNFFAGLGAQLTGRFSLLTFPQETIEWHSFCTSGYYTDRVYLPGDNNEHLPARGGWFDQYREQVVRVPFSANWENGNSDELLAWVDFVETQNSNPELRASGQTPLGRSMFYAGEYMRQHVVVDGKSCQDDKDCKSADYVCIDGRCHDPIKHCRKNILLVFTDGAESTNARADDFYNPVVQARRMKFGLGCMSDEDCLGGATCSAEGVCERLPITAGPCSADGDCPGEAYCVDGLCELPGFQWPTNLGACNQSGKACKVGQGGDCSGFLEQCESLNARYDDGASGGNRLVAPDGSAIEVTTHVINLDPDTAESRLIADHGGGLHFGADISSPELLEAILQRMVDLKYGLTCASPDEEQ